MSRNSQRATSNVVRHPALSGNVSRIQDDQPILNTDQARIEMIREWLKQIDDLVMLVRSTVDLCERESRSK